LRQVFNDTDAEVLWLIIGAPEELEQREGGVTGQGQAQAARIFSAVTTCSAEPVKLHFPALLVTAVSI
jgi:hypothetical protein